MILPHPSWGKARGGGHAATGIPESALNPLNPPDALPALRAGLSRSHMAHYEYMALAEQDLRFARSYVIIVLTSKLQ